jgi:hypothetical protein
MCDRVIIYETVGGSKKIKGFESWCSIIYKSVNCL